MEPGRSRAGGSGTNFPHFRPFPGDALRQIVAHFKKRGGKMKSAEYFSHFSPFFFLLRFPQVSLGLMIVLER